MTERNTAIGGATSLGDAGVDRRAPAETLPPGNAPDDQKRLYRDVCLWLEANAGRSEVEACRALGVELAVYRLAKQRLVASPDEAFYFGPDCRIRPRHERRRGTLPPRPSTEKTS